MSNPMIRHPDAATLLSFAAASLPEALAAVVAAHASMCGECRSEIEDMEMVGAALLSASDADASGPPPRVPLRVPPRPADGEANEPAPARRAEDGRLPAAIARAYGLTFDTIPWRRLGPGVWHYPLGLSAKGQGDLRLLKIGPGREMPDHGHGGTELTLVLDGAYADETGTYRRGDLQDVDEETEHRPVADGVLGCVCLIASERPARFKSLVGRLLQPWTGM